MPQNSIDAIALLAKFVKKHAPNLSFSILEIGARPVSEAPEPYTALLDVFDHVRISAFEIEEELCSELNNKAHKNVHYYPCALGEKNGTQTLYETMHPMCSSLYEPDTELMQKYFNLESAHTKTTHEIKVRSLDSFVDEHPIGPIDMVKIDVQGAELDIFKGGQTALKNTLAIVSEVEFIPLYKKQPLFGDVSAYLETQGMMFHNFVTLSGRCLTPIAINNNPNHPSQVMWADAMFIKNIADLAKEDDAALYKLALFAFMYASADLTFYCFKLLDERNQTKLCEGFTQLGK